MLHIHEGTEDSAERERAFFSLFFCFVVHSCMRLQRFTGEGGENMCIMRAKLGKKKLMTLVEHKNVVSFQMSLAKVMKSTVQTALPKKTNPKETSA